MVVWTVIYAWYSILPFAHPDPRDPVGGMGHGLMSADQPWSGHYRVMPPLYMLAHTTQFVRPGVCKYVDSAAVLKGGLLNVLGAPNPNKGKGPSQYNMSASMVAFVCEDDKTFTLVAETSESEVAIDGTFTVTPPAFHDVTTPLHLWETCNNSYFMNKDELLTRIDSDAGMSYKAAFKPQCVYTITSSTGQSAVPAALPAIPASAPFPFPYTDTFESYTDESTVKYFTDQGGSFNAAPAPAVEGKAATSAGMALHQVVDVRPIEWGHNPDPVTIGGSITWTDYTVTAKVMIGSKSPLPPTPPVVPALVPSAAQPSATSVKLCGRIGTYSRGGSPPNGYCLIVDEAGSWYISSGGTKGDAREQENVIASGKLPAAVAGASAANKWMTLSLTFAGTSITPSVDGTALKAVTDGKFKAGMVGMGSGWNTAWFDDLKIEK
jgi:hypothetical protein